MTSAAIVALSARVATNTLTASDIAALTTALNFIAPTFEGPDETSSVVFSDEENAREWIAALYAIQAEGGGGPPVPGTPTAILNFASIADLEAFDVTTLGTPLLGQQAFVQTNGSWWTLAGSAEPVDGITIVDANGTPPIQWLRENVSGLLAGYLLQTSWFVDPQNVSGNASDENTGFDDVNALLSKAEIYRRWGYTWAPELDGVAVTISYMSSDVGAPSAGNDPGLFAPSFLNGASLTQQPASIPTPVFVGTLNVVTPKSVSGNQSLTTSFNTTSGGPAVGQMLINTTRGNSVAFIVAALGGGVFEISQPLAPFVPGNVPAPTNVDTWVTTDAIDGFELLQIDLAGVGGSAAGLEASTAPQHTVYLLNVVDADPTDGGSAALAVDGQSYACLAQCQVSRRTAYRHGQIAATVFMNVGFQSAVQSRDNTFTPSMAGGYVSAGCALQSFGFSNFPHFAGAANVFESPADLNDAIYVSGTLVVKGQWLLLNPAGIVSGPGTLNVLGALTYAGTAVAQLPIATKELNAVSAGYSNATGGGGVVVVHHVATLSSADLDAAAGAAGYGGFAYGGGATITNADQP